MKNVTHILVQACPRYWEDATVNGIEDEDGTLIPGREGEIWHAWINLEEGRIEDWEEGTTAKIHYKVCDDGEYWLTDSDKNLLYKSEGYYVPDEYLCHGSNGYRDYIILEVDEDGYIENYEQPVFIKEDWVSV